MSYHGYKVRRKRKAISLDPVKPVECVESVDVTPSLASILKKRKTQGDPPRKPPRKSGGLKKSRNRPGKRPREQPGKRKSQSVTSSHRVSWVPTLTLAQLVAQTQPRQPRHRLECVESVSVLPSSPLLQHHDKGDATGELLNTCKESLEMVAHCEFKWKLALDVRRPRQPFRRAQANRKWGVIKTELEDHFKFHKFRQKKKSLQRAAFAAYYLEDWMAKRYERVIHTANYVNSGDVLVLARYPEFIERRYHALATADLTFGADEGEEERIAKLMGWNVVAGITAHMTDSEALDSPHHTHSPRYQHHYDEDAAPPPHYVCHNCHQKGHWKRDCQNGKRMRATGIPRSFLETVEKPDVTVPGYCMEDGTLKQWKTPHNVPSFLKY